MFVEFTLYWWLEMIYIVNDYIVQTNEKIKIKLGTVIF